MVSGLLLYQIGRSDYNIQRNLHNVCYRSDPYQFTAGIHIEVEIIANEYNYTAYATLAKAYFCSRFNPLWL
jgi:hypothetical protein